MRKSILTAIVAVIGCCLLIASTNFPTNLDTYTDKTSSDLITSAGWNNIQDAVEAIEAKVGKDGSDVSTSHDRMLSNLTANTEFTSDYANIALALAASTTGILRVNDNETLTAAATFPSTLRVSVDHGKAITLGNYNLTINGPFDGADTCFTYSGTGAVSFGTNTARTFYPQWWGAKADGATDDTAAIRRMFAAVPDGAHVVFPRGSGAYVCSPTTSINITSDVTVEFEDGAELDVSGATASPVFDIYGTVGTYYALGADVTDIDTRTITCHSTLAASLAGGDLIHLTSDNSKGGNGGTWYSQGGSYFKGEIAEVLSVSGTSVTLKQSLCDTYSTAGIVVSKITPITGKLVNVSIAGDPDDDLVGIRTKWTRGLRIEGGNLKGFGDTALSHQYGYDSTVEDLRVSDLWQSASTTSYGLTLYSCQHASVRGCHLYGGRGALYLAGQEPSRDILISDCKLDGYNDATYGAGSLYSLPNCDDVIVSGCTIRGGLEMSGRNRKICGNIIATERNDTDTALLNVSMDTDLVEFNDNRIANDLTLSRGVTVNLSVAGTELDVLMIKDNAIDVSGQGIRLYAATSGQTLSIASADLSGNDIQSTGTGNTGIYISAYDDTTKIDFDSLSIKGGRVKSAGNCITGQRLSAEAISIDGVDLRPDSAFPPISIYLTSDIEKVFCRNNHFYDGSYNVITCDDYIDFSGNTLESMSANGGVKLTATDILFRDNEQISCTGSISLTGRYFSEIYGDGRVVTWSATSAPASGTWKVGDICRRSVPIAIYGVGPGWVCVTAGTPGTWKEMAPLDP